MLSEDIRTVVFDLDGTMYDKHGLAKRMVRRLWWCLPLLLTERLARRTMHQHQYASKEAFYNAFFTKMAKRHIWSARMAERWYNRVYIPAMVRLIGKYHRPRPETLALMALCREKGLRMAVYSDYGSVEQKLAVLGIDASQFELLADAPSMGALKPSEQSARRVLDLLKADAATTLFVGDRDDTDGETARRVGARFLKV